MAEMIVRDRERHGYTQSAECWLEHGVRGGSDGLKQVQGSRGGRGLLR